MDMPTRGVVLIASTRPQFSPIANSSAITRTMTRAQVEECGLKILKLASQGVSSLTISQTGLVEGFLALAVRRQIDLDPMAL